MKKAQEIDVNGTPVRVMRVGDDDFICLTDMAAGRYDETRAADVIKNWLRARYTLEFLGTWEQLHNPTFKVVEFDHFKARAGLPSFTLSVSEWIDSTNAIGLIVKNGHYGGSMENLNAVMIQDGIPQPERLRRLNEIAIHQMRVLSSGGGRNLLR